MMMDWMVLLMGIIQWLILLVDVLFIHEFVEIYRGIVISASAFSILGAATFIVFYFGTIQEENQENEKIQL